MTQDEKDILLKDLSASLQRALSARLPYGVICKDDNINTTGTLSQMGLHYDMCALDKDNGESEYCYIYNCKPYLFPLASMMDEQKEEFDRLYTYDALIIEPQWKLIDWLNKNLFDYRGLIEKGLAIDATNLNIY